ncbi:MAG TPA: hypothetical protein VGL18_12810 [Actinomycetota bacterium]
MDWKTRFPVGLALLAALMLAGGVSAATSMKLASAQNKAALVLASHHESADPKEDEDPGESEPSEESEPADESEPTHGGGRSMHGGSVERFHEDCELPEGVPALEGNFTHGDYVSAFAKAGDHEALLAAAHSPCGKPMKGKKANDRAHGKSAKSHAKSGHHGKSKNHRS